MKKRYRENIKRFLCVLLGHRYRRMHTEYKKRTDEYVYVYKCIRCGKIKTVTIPGLVIVSGGKVYKGGQG